MNTTFLIVNNNSKLIEFPNEQCDIFKDLIIPKGYIVSASPGCKINLINSSKIVSYSPLLFFHIYKPFFEEIKILWSLLYLFVLDNR